MRTPQTQKGPDVTPVIDAFDLQRFVAAQDPVFDRVRAELRNGRKTSHWMWFVFPQIQGLGYSAMARKFAISSREEAQAYARHPRDIGRSRGERRGAAGDRVITGFGASPSPSS